jgi:hypothetical protein
MYQTTFLHYLIKWINNSIQTKRLSIIYLKTSWYFKTINNARMLASNSPLQRDCIALSIKYIPYF